MVPVHVSAVVSTEKLRNVPRAASSAINPHLISTVLIPIGSEHVRLRLLDALTGSALSSALNMFRYAGLRFARYDATPSQPSASIFDFFCPPKPCR